MPIFLGICWCNIYADCFFDTLLYSDKEIAEIWMGPGVYHRVLLKTPSVCSSVSLGEVSMVSETFEVLWCMCVWKVNSGGGKRVNVIGDYGTMGSGSRYKGYMRLEQCFKLRINWGPCRAIYTASVPPVPPVMLWCGVGRPANCPVLSLYLIQFHLWCWLYSVMLSKILN